MRRRKGLDGESVWVRERERVEDKLSDIWYWSTPLTCNYAGSAQKAFFLMILPEMVAQKGFQDAPLIHLKQVSRLILN